MGARSVDDKPSDTLVVVSGEGSWTGSSTLPHLHHFIRRFARIPSSRGFEHDLVDVAPRPVLAGLERPDYRVPDLLEVLRRVLAEAIVAAADVPAGQAQPQVHPGR